MTRRTFFTEPGDSLLLSHDPISAALRTQRVIHALGTREVVASPLTRLPIPTNKMNASAASLWLPFWWLSKDVIDPMTLDDGSMEGPNTRAVRLALILEDSGLYDPSTGLWTDVLASRGIDTTTQDGVDRVQAWLDGDDDEALSELDETGLQTPNYGRTMLESSAGLQDRLFRCVWHDGAVSLLDIVDEMLTEGELASVRPVADIAATWFQGSGHWEDRPFKASLQGVLALRTQLRELVDAYDDANASLVYALLD